jgi:pentatricopeptide repeat protein
LVIKAISLSDDKDAVSQAWAILHQLGYPQKNAKDVEPFDIPITTFNSMLKLFARRGMANEAEALLQEIDEFIIQGKSKGSGPDIQSYEAVLEALGKTNDSDAVERAEALVTRVEVMSELGGGGMQQPSLKMYNELLNVYGESGKVGSAERLLARLHEQSPKPDAFSYATTIKALKNSGKSKDIAVARAKELAQALDQSSNGARINEIIFAHRLSILAKFGLAAQAENLLQEMRHKHKTGELKQGPGVIHHTAVLNAWAKSDDKRAISRAERLFEKMKADPNLELDLAAYHGLLLNYSVRGISPKARRLLQTVLDSETIQPNRNTFTMVIDSYSRSSSTANAGVKAEELLDQMRQLHAAGNANVEPDSVSYASVIRCKQASTSKPINELTEFDKLQLMRELQIENWPFQ